MNAHKLPVLYSFRRCPYAIRARLGLYYSGIQVELREVDLNAIPEALAILVPDNPTVPVLQLTHGKVLEESWDILLWAVQQADPEQWSDPEQALAAEQWIEMNDFSFKGDLDRYKYFDRYPEQSQLQYREQAEEFIQELEQALSINQFLLGPRFSVADAGILPFIRQFALVDREWFDQAPYPRVRQWLDDFLASPSFQAIMDKQEIWQPGDAPRWLIPPR